MGGWYRPSPIVKTFRCLYYRKSAGEGFINLPDQIQYSKLVGGKKIRRPYLYIEYSIK